MEAETPYPALSALSEDLVRIADAIAPRIVTIDVGGHWTATGTVWRDGVVVTTAHAMRDTEHLRVIAHGQAPAAAIFGGWDLASDLAVLKVEGLKGPDPGEADGEAARAVRTGQLAVVMAGAGPNGPRARLAMVTAVGPLARTRRGTRLARVLELDIAPFPGYSGGPLLDARGRIVAINTAGIARGMALALPVDLVSAMIDELLVRGRVARGYLGVGTQPVRIGRAGTADATDARGLLVHSLEPGGPAERAGALVGDILVSIEGRSLGSPEELVGELGGTRVGESVRMGVLRGGNSVEIPVVVGERPARTAGRHCPAR
jgi:S1-C subfamily serine protease